MENKIKIFVIEDNRGLPDYIASILRKEGYGIKTYSSQTDALENIEREIPDLIVSEFQSPNINGLDICKTLKRKGTFHHIPIIIVLSDQPQPSDKSKIISAGADDYIEKPLIKDELALKIKLNLYRREKLHDVDTLTKLPGASSLYKELQKRLESKIPFAAYYADIYKFNEFKQRYGAKKGNEVIQYTCSLILKSLRDLGSPADFTSHFQDGFVLITLTDIMNDISNKIIRDFDKDIASFYEEADRKNGYILIKNRKGEIQKIPLLRIHIGVVNNEHYKFISPAQVMQTAIELKNFAQKNFDKSMYVIERRKSYPFH
ncbi:MAG: response regulator [Candidatus Omnitrophota bacterium]